MFDKVLSGTKKPETNNQAIELTSKEYAWNEKQTFRLAFVVLLLQFRYQEDKKQLTEKVKQLTIDLRSEKGIKKRKEVEIRFVVITFEIFSLM